MADHDTHDHTGIPGCGGTDLDAIITASAGQDIADALSGAAAPDAGNVFATMADVGGGGGPANWLIDGNLFLGSMGNTNWSSFNQDNTEIFGGDMETSGAQNDEIYWDIGISGGTWDFTLLHYKGTNRGIYTVSIDGSSIGTIDGYNGSALRNSLDTLTGISIADGKRRLKLKMATKNGSSGGYFGTAQAWQFRRTA